MPANIAQRFTNEPPDAGIFLNPQGTKLCEHRHRTAARKGLAPQPKAKLKQ